MSISIFTPTHNLCWLHEAYAGLLSQTRKDWEWIVVPNGPARGYFRGYNDPRVRVINCPREIDGKIGALKAFACAQAKGVAVLELDHDDVLMPEAIAEAEAAFADESVDFAYSNSVNHDFRVDYPTVWSGLYGWTHRPFSWQGRWMLESVSAKPYPANLSRIWYAPNHFRAWRKTFYDRIGGHNRGMTIADDHELICRTYIEGTMRHIDKPLYVYRINGENSWIKHQDAIQKVQWSNHDTYIERMVEKWCRLEGGLPRIAVGENSPRDGYEPVKFDESGIKTWNLEDSSIGCIRATNVFQLIADPVQLMNESYRLLAHGGWLLVTVPASSGVGACDNPANRSLWNWRSFRYYTEKNMQEHVLGLHCRFQTVKCDTVKTSEGVEYVIAHLIAIKREEPRFYGPLLI